jgi:choline dehydrogenase-like flavoprotein
MSTKACSPYRRLLNIRSEIRRGRLYQPSEAQGVGGGTLRYLAYVPRLRPDDFRVYTDDGVAADWPITYDDLVPYYRKVELELGVSGLAGDPWTPQVDPYPNPPFPYSYANKIIKRGCDKLGIRLWPAPMARLSRYFDGRPKCIQCGQCETGCMSGAKSSHGCDLCGESRSDRQGGNTASQPRHRDSGGQPRQSQKCCLLR